MNQKNLFIIFGTIILVIFISGYTQLVREKIISNLMDQLNSDVINYSASYKKSHEIHYWGGQRSGATDYIDNSTIDITLQNNEVVNYSFRREFKGHPYGNLELQERNYYEYYDKSKTGLCREISIEKSECEFSQFSPPKLGGKLQGCKVTRNLVTGRLIGYEECKCGEHAIPIEVIPGFACSEEVNTENMGPVSKNGYAFYYPETKEGFCYYTAKDLNTSEYWAFECTSDIVLISTSKYNISNLEGAICKGYGDYCDCTFNPPKKSITCSKEIPDSFDAEIKKDLIEYLNEVGIKSITEEDNENGHCYSFFYNKLNHYFCFNEQNLITFAQWGIGREGSSTGVDVNKIEKT